MSACGKLWRPNLKTGSVMPSSTRGRPGKRRRQHQAYGAWRTEGPVFPVVVTHVNQANAAPGHEPEQGMPVRETAADESGEGIAGAPPGHV